MDKIMSQSEIDKLLRSLGVKSENLHRSGEAMDDPLEDDSDFDPDGMIIPFDLTAQDRIFRGRLPNLEIIHERFAVGFKKALTQLLRQVVDITYQSIEFVKFLEFYKCCPVPSHLNVFHCKPLPGNALLFWETTLVYRLLDLFCGGTGDKNKNAGVDMTAIEQVFGERLSLG
ncbi:MAG: hypothetical protein HQM12_21190 [SAR324 cluster bacterium]|nr:hypothetical protein [SAR324 cluster bacterium]